MQLDLKTIVVIVLIAGFVLSVNFTLFAVMRGSRSIKSEANKWSQALGGGREAQAKTDAQFAALHSAVANLKANPSSEPPADSETPPNE
jgi:hypothetical protein